MALADRGLEGGRDCGETGFEMANQSLVRDEGVQ